MLLFEDRSLSGDTERSTNLPSLVSLIGRASQRRPLIGDKTTVHFVTAVSRLLIELGRLHCGLVTKARHAVCVEPRFSLTLLCNQPAHTHTHVHTDE